MAPRKQKRNKPGTYVGHKRALGIVAGTLAVPLVRYIGHRTGLSARGSAAIRKLMAKGRKLTKKAVTSRERRLGERAKRVGGMAKAIKNTGRMKYSLSKTASGHKSVRQVAGALNASKHRKPIRQVRKTIIKAGPAARSAFKKVTRIRWRGPRSTSTALVVRRR